jgi:hypothetical protein
MTPLADAPAAPVAVDNNARKGVVPAEQAGDLSDISFGKLLPHQARRDGLSVDLDGRDHIQLVTEFLAQFPQPGDISFPVPTQSKIIPHPELL